MSKKKPLDLIAKNLTVPKEVQARSAKGYARGGRAGGTAAKQKGGSR